MGRCQRAVCYALTALRVACTKEIVSWCYPSPAQSRKQRKNRSRGVVLAARQMAIKVGREWPGGNVWRLRDDADVK
jgi:hypothetical protein